MIIRVDSNTASYVACNLTIVIIIVTLIIMRVEARVSLTVTVFDLYDVFSFALTNIV